VVGPILFVVVLLIEGATRPGYDAWTHYGSELGLSNQGWEQIANFIVCGLLSLGFALGLHRVLHSGKGATWGPILIGAFGLGLVSAGIFVTDPVHGYPPGTPANANSLSWHGIIHGISGLVCFIGIAVACFVIARRFAGNSQWRGWAAYTNITGIVVLGSFVFINVVISPLADHNIWLNAPIGLFQRIGIIAGWGWLSLFAFKLLRTPS